ncbi:hypothetical protein LTR91_019120 [Friedmanniomyces endolithicus]|uniref:AB hydrolase-1 domain-containing protein n=1 Tax=Friedmanniomyces endolithicus TaxID=329885 RepID=A0AAN6K4C9_9PEZI|nr:hypothetical protein LTR94_015555 [Friedmanniomyces endolithicus]KAK0782471.1 hypothetical protein LTR38_013336 [Friedmanniomyces endolithicus]KAK0793201.1 hypothetical protein LTR75_011241 [Friedmanniomyces endolithicus]KAK0809620.1 hypothetical protein LTR59_002481 [Friedmanniomyces endolithicus]KAK0844923.1 hypothetical protein LTR03_007773 [Friedmanniomyces endolithicus]
MEKFEHKTLETTPHNLTYSYYLSPNFHNPATPSAPTLVLCHGFPDSAWLWSRAIPHLLPLPYRILLLDLLGFGDSSKPTTPALYNYRLQASSLAQILDHEHAPDNIIPVGHDWGSGTVQRFYLYHRHRCAGLALLSLAYQIPSPHPFDLETANETTAKRFGYPQWEYWNFFTAPDAPRLLMENLDRFWEVNNGFLASPDPKEKGADIWMREMFCVPGAMREYITRTGKYADFTVELRPYARDEKLRQAYRERMRMDGFEGPVCYYTSLANNTMHEDERSLCQAADNVDKKITVPVLYIGQTGDWVCRTDLMGDAKEAGLVKDVEERVVDAGHWCLYDEEKSEEIAGVIGEWLGRKFPVK